ncbi:ubiquitin-associated domain-containing protein 1-like [Actinia tenebrosa]|uniref:Ubiquitin-associated domain-containing protein 1-like n=1 Tax=Actinia tenebrosa TaxID=6105 RepID=A0A6P8IB13_ACTTE|nr:ubiquitin-associated domain-containing protein 1-like [Actinia tenebrosa]
MRDLELQGLKSLNAVPLIQIKVTNASGKEVALTVSCKDRVAVVKDKALGGEFYKDSSSYKLVIGKCRRILDDGKSLEEEGVQEDDELVLLKRRQNTNEDKNQKRVSSKGPDIATIQRLTLKLEARKKEETPPSSSGGSIDFNTELRRILVSLIDSSLLLQSIDEYDEEGNLYKGTSNAEASSSSSGDKTDEGLKGRIDDDEFAVNPEILKQFTDMGFTEAKATKALRIHRMSPMQAMEWLLQHESDPDLDESEPLTVGYSRTRRKRREFTPNPRAVENLKEMGFQEEDILVALKVTGNNQEAACDWLLGDKKCGVVNIDEGLDQDSPMYKAIMENPMVQLGLYNPRILAAFEDMLESPTNSGMYISDPETGPVLLQISRIVQGFAR